MAAVCGGLALPGCGGDDEEKGRPIPADSAAQLQERLNVVQRQFDVAGGACKDLQDETFRVIEDDLNALPSDVDPDVRSALEESFTRLQELTSEQCDEEKGQETTPTETTPTVPPETETVPTETETAPTETTPTDEQDQENGKGQGKGKNKNKDNQNNQGGGQIAPPGVGGGAPAAPGD
jgi:hypothetical protein